MPETKKTVHALLHGKALCGFLKKQAVVDWPTNHCWVRVQEADKINCSSCLAKAKDILGEENYNRNRM